MRRLASACAALLALALAGCVLARPAEMPKLANAVVSSDFESYALRRIGLLPFTGRGLTTTQGLDLQRALHSELAQSTPFELVLLDGDDLAELDASDPYRRGWYKPKTIIGLSERYNLDGILFGIVTQERFFPPQLLSLQVDLVSAETGLVIWSGSVNLDASDPRVVSGLKVYYGFEEDDDQAWRVALLSPERFARFAAFQIACLL
ncbi:MAG: hypothetical protein HOP15_17330 [Planctomycetes bacterium]|nr:hypothetical protein [Planctomycetota bacterium]